MIKINLLSPWDKENLKWEKINKFLIDSILWVVLVQTFFMAVFIFSLEYLKIEEASIIAQLEDLESMTETIEVRETETDMEEYQKRIENIYALQDEHMVWSIVFENLADNIPNDVKLESMIAQEYVETDKRGKAKTSDKFKISLTGTAKTREDLLDFENRLKGMEMVFDLESDDSNYVEAINTDFTYYFFVDRDYLLK
ncbi:MAG: hypothetical protein PHI66_04480 [Candidatus Pacebacteria bacterium]|nr:hypothetical protein [Candidatus Paceibacterota bacterium]